MIFPLYNLAAEGHRGLRVWCHVLKEASTSFAAVPARVLLGLGARRQADTLSWR